MHPFFMYSILIAAVCIMSVLGLEPYLSKYYGEGSMWHTTSRVVMLIGLALIAVLGLTQLSVIVTNYWWG